MRPATGRMSWFSWDRIVAISIVSVALFAATFLSDLYLQTIGAPWSAMIIKNVFVGLLGGAFLLSYEIKVSRDHEFKRAKERIIMIAELNNEVRRSLTMIGLSAGLEQRDERLRRLDDAMARIDSVLTDLLTNAASGESSRARASVERHASPDVTPVPGHHRGDAAHIA